MNGRFGLIGVFRAIYQANVVDPEAWTDFRALMIDATEALRAMRETTVAQQAAAAAATLSNPTPAVADTRTLLDVLMERNPDFTPIVNDILDDMAAPDPEVIVIDDEPAESSSSSSSSKDSDEGSGGGASGSGKSAAKRKVNNVTNTRATKRSKH